MCEWLLFGILESYAVKWFMRLTGMQLAEVICICNKGCLKSPINHL